MRILGLYQHPEHVCFRYRLQAFRPFWEQAGHQVAFRGWPRWWSFGSGFFQSLREADLVIIQRRLLTPGYLWRIRKAARRLAFDFDDAVFLRDSFDPRGLASPRRQFGFEAMVQAADVVIAGNVFLSRQAQRLVRPDRVELIPTCLNTDGYPAAPHYQTNGPRLVW